MFFAIFFSAALLASAAKTTRWHQLENYSFEAYESEFQKVYPNRGARGERKALFEKQLGKIKAHNKAGFAWKAGVNHMSDWKQEEFEALLGLARSQLPSSSPEQQQLESAGKAALPPPDSADWRGKGVLTTIKDQGHCGSCWAFAATEAMESFSAIKNGHLNALSEQNVLDCTPNPDHCGGTGGCQGGIPELAFEAMRNKGLASEWQYPYTSYWGQNMPQCGWNASKFSNLVNVTGHVVLPKNDETELARAVADKGPVAVTVDASSWASYESGVFDGCNQTNPHLNHLVQLVAYDQDHWTIRNSWTPQWGEDGFMRIARASAHGRCGKDLWPLDGSDCTGSPSEVTVCGTCGIAYDSSFPLIG